MPWGIKYSAASILFPWMQPVFLIFLRFVLTQWIIIVPWKPAHHKSIGLSYPQIHFCNNPPLLPQVRYTKQSGKHIHTCMHRTTTDIETWVDLTQSRMRRFYAAWLILMYFQEFKCAAYIERIPAGFTQTGYRWRRFPFHDNLLCWNDIWNSLHDIKHEYILHTLMFFEYKYK